MASADGVLYTSINYDTGWTVYIDDEKVRADKYHALGDGALLAVDITAGEHTVRLKYVPDGLIVGALISLVTLLMFILICIISKTGYFKFSPELYVEEDYENEGEDGILEPVDIETLLEDYGTADDDDVTEPTTETTYTEVSEESENDSQPDESDENEE